VADASRVFGVAQTVEIECARRQVHDLPRIVTVTGDDVASRDRGAHRRELGVCRERGDEVERDLHRDLRVLGYVQHFVAEQLDDAATELDDDLRHLSIELAERMCEVSLRVGSRRDARR
jgi:hypothetical protein